MRLKLSSNNHVKLWIPNIFDYESIPNIFNRFKEAIDNPTRNDTKMKPFTLIEKKLDS